MKIKKEKKKEGKGGVWFSILPVDRLGNTTAAR